MAESRINSTKGIRIVSLGKIKRPTELKFIEPVPLKKLKILQTYSTSSEQKKQFKLKIPNYDLKAELKLFQQDISPYESQFESPVKLHKTQPKSPSKPKSPIKSSPQRIKSPNTNKKRKLLHKGTHSFSSIPSPCNRRTTTRLKGITEKNYSPYLFTYQNNQQVPLASCKNIQTSKQIKTIDHL